MRAAKLISNVINPFLVTFAVIVLVSFQSTSGAAEALKWLSISIALSVLPVFIIIILLVRLHKLDGLFINSRQQRKKVYLLVIFWGIAANIILYYLGVPRLLLATFGAGLAAIVVFMCINLLWKISLHTAFITGSAVILTLVYGAAGAAAIVFIPPVVWARLKMKLHTPAQASAGVLLSACIVALVFRGYGII